MRKLTEHQKKVFTKNETRFFPNSGEDQQKKVFTKNGTLFSPNSSGDLRSDAEQSQTIGGDTVKLLGGYIPPGFRHPCLRVM